MTGRARVDEHAGKVRAAAVGIADLCCGDDYTDEKYEAAFKELTEPLDSLLSELASVKDLLGALDRAAYYYRRELREIIADCGHDKPDIAKIKERAETAIRAADHELAGAGA